MFKYLIIFLLFLAGGADLAAQSGSGADSSRFDRIKLAKEAFLREELPLTDTEATSFFPIYWRYEKEMRQYRRTKHGSRGHGPTVLTEKEALNVLREHREKRQRMLELHNEAEAAYLSVLPATKVIRLDHAEREFREKLLRRLKQSRGGERN